MPFHLDLDTGQSADKIQHKQAILLIGSCFTEHMERRLGDLKFDCRANPFGIVFNPLSIASALERIIDHRLFTEADVMDHNESWFSLETHTSLTAFSKTELLKTLNAVVREWHDRLKKADWLMLTFGSAFYYEYHPSGLIVANCHKLPAKAFTKELAAPSVIEETYSGVMEKLSRFNPSLKVLVTVSPVKHLRDGVVENNLSKGVLAYSAHAIVKQHAIASYFPSYELVNDDLRDYRFYEADMAHPNKQAIDYVWGKFSGTYFTPETQALLEKIRELTAAAHHKPLRADTKAHSAFRTVQLHKCLDLKSRFPYLDLEKEIQHFSS
jgi:hypothetical protein